MSQNVIAERPPCYELFIAPLQVVFDPNTFERVQFAYFVSKFGHEKQVRDDGTRYFDHPKAAAWIYINELGGRDPETIIDILLHDLQEDSYLLSPYRIALNFGVETAFDVRALTKLPKDKEGKSKETTEEYLYRVMSRGGRVIFAKLCDRLHNLRSLNNCSEEKRAKTIAETQQYHIPMLFKALEDCGGEWAAYVPYLRKAFEEAIEKYQ